jgi:hypothetical protein
MKIMGGKFSHKLEVLLPWILLNRNFLKENWQYPHAGWENFGARIFSKLLLGQCTYGKHPVVNTVKQKGCRMLELTLCLTRFEDSGSGGSWHKFRPSKKGGCRSCYRELSSII